VIHAVDEMEQPVMVDPHDADRREAGQVGRVRWPLLGQPRSERPFARMRHLELEDEQRDRDREHAVAERFDSGGLP
jgi:hypothetical protein